MKKIISRMVNGLLICEFVLLVISLVMSYFFVKDPDGYKIEVIGEKNK